MYLFISKDDILPKLSNVILIVSRGARKRTGTAQTNREFGNTLCFSQKSYFGTVRSMNRWWETKIRKEGILLLVHRCVIVVFLFCNLVWRKTCNRLGAILFLFTMLLQEREWNICNINDPPLASAAAIIRSYRNYRKCIFYHSFIVDEAPDYLSNGDSSRNRNLHDLVVQESVKKEKEKDDSTKADLPTNAMWRI